MVSQGRTSACQLKVVFLVIVIEDGRFVPAIRAADSDYLVAVLRSDGVGAVAVLEVLSLGEVSYQGLADGHGFALRNVLIVFARHTDINVVIPRDEAFMSNCSQAGPISAQIGEMILFTEVYECLEGFQKDLLFL